MNCPQCGAPLSDVTEHNYFRCDYCGSIHIPQASIDGVKSLKKPGGLDCPVCRQALVVAALDGLRVLHCENCQGILFNQSTFGETLRYLRSHAPELAQMPKPLNRSELQRKVLCPSCGRLMDTHPYGGPGNVVIDTCIHCALLWLDPSELHRMVTAPGRDRGRWFAVNEDDDRPYRR